MVALFIDLIWLMSIGVIFIYPILIRRYIKTWNKLPEWQIPKNWQPKTKVSIIIPARNEAAGIKACLDSVLKQNYPPELFEIIVVDDESTDNTAVLVQSIIKSNRTSISVKLLNNADFLSKQPSVSHKKAAITYGVANASGTLIITTDADCIVPETWLNNIVSYYEKTNAAFIAAPVNFHNENNTLERFQSLDYIGMMLITGAGIHGKFGWMSNGANLAYPKEIFIEMEGFSEIEHIASGDDLLFMQKVAERYPDRVGFIKSTAATVLSTPQKTWDSFLEQRVRWAGKTGAYRQPQLVFTQSIVFLYCALIFFSILLMLYLGPPGVLLFLILFSVKANTDFILLKKASSFFNRKDLMKIFLKGEVMHSVYIFLTGLYSVTRKEHMWKGRKVK
jgi:cellulose synthase/poly-beta-1,6-N-acetylglucosamine synthase-like glycosyltransferase